MLANATHVLCDAISLVLDRMPFDEVAGRVTPWWCGFDQVLPSKLAVERSSSSRWAITSSAKSSMPQFV